MGNCGSMSNENLVVHPSDFVGIEIVCKSWKKTYSNLFDYTAQSNQLNTKLFTIADETRIFKRNGMYELIPYALREKNYQMMQGSQATIDVLINTDKKKSKEEEKTYSIVSKCEKTKQQPWIVVKSLPSKRYVIKEGDMLRIGKQRVRVKEIIEKEEETKEEDQEIISKGLIYQDLTREGKPLEVSEDDLNGYVCRFCLDTAEVGHPLMAPCNCAGSSKYVHLKCVQTWLTKTINPRNIGKATAITWKPLVCQLCGKTLPFKVYLDGKRYFTVNIPKPRRPYVVLNPIYKQKQPNKAKIYLLVSFAEQKQMVIGRKTDSDIVISEDSTVSRHHSKMIFESSKTGLGKFVILDNQSKFGTLVLLRKQFQMRHQLNGISIQLGGDVLQLRVGAKNVSQETDLQNLINKSQSDSSDEHEEEQEEANEPSPSPQLQADQAEPESNNVQ